MPKVDLQPSINFTIFYMTTIWNNSVYGSHFENLLKLNLKIKKCFGIGQPF